MQKKLLQTIGTAVIALTCLAPSFALAVDSPLPDQIDALGDGGAAGINNAQNGLQDVTITNPIGGTPENPAGVTSIRSFVALIIRAMLGLVGSFALLMFVYGGFSWLTSRGNHEMIAKGSHTMTWAAAGLVLIFSSYAIVEYVFKVIGAK